MHGITWTTTIDAALDALTNLTRRHPDLDTDPDLTLARLALLR